MKFPSWEKEKWVDMKQNPLIQPVTGATPGNVIGDPQVILPGEFDDEWHMFLIGRAKFYRFDSVDGINWNHVYSLDWMCGPMCVTTDGLVWIAYYTQVIDKECVISYRTSADLSIWSEPKVVLKAEYEWEREGKLVQVRNPNVIQLPNGKYRMYYSGGTIWMDDCGYEEPKYIGYAESDSPFGGFVKNPTPIIGPDINNKFRNFGAGAIKVFNLSGRYLGLMNGIYLDEEGHSRSAIDVLMSDDGINWEEAPYSPIILPTSGWKKALVYQLDLRYYEDKLWLFYNARDGWKGGIEWIGGSILENVKDIPQKFWRLPKKSKALQHDHA